MMAANSSIEWTGSTWNPVTGCSKISAGCRNCYAERMARRLQGMGHPNYRNGFRVTLHPHVVDLPLTWKNPRTIFVNSMSDLFHEKVPTAFIQKIFSEMVKAKWHRFQVLTQRSERLLELNAILPWTRNIWMGVTIEDKSVINRIVHLRKTTASVKFLSFEPLLGPLPDLSLTGIDWVIVGGESRPGARYMDPSWVA